MHLRNPYGPKVIQEVQKASDSASPLALTTRPCQVATSPARRMTWRSILAGGRQYHHCSTAFIKGRHLARFPTLLDKEAHLPYGISLLCQFALPLTAVAKFVKNLEKFWRNFGEICEDCQFTWFSNTWISRWGGTNSDVAKKTVLQLILFYQIFNLLSTLLKVVGQEFRFPSAEIMLKKIVR